VPISAELELKTTSHLLAKSPTVRPKTASQLKRIKFKTLIHLLAKESPVRSKSYSCLIKMKNFEPSLNKVSSRRLLYIS
jgi:hypothetical protein